MARSWGGALRALPQAILFHAFSVMNCVSFIGQREEILPDARSIQPTNQCLGQASRDGVVEVAEHLELLKQARS